MGPVVIYVKTTERGGFQNWRLPNPFKSFVGFSSIAADANEEEE